MENPALDNFASMSERWRSLTLEHYEPLSESKRDAIVQETLDAIKDHKLPEGSEVTGAFGWSNATHLDDDGYNVRFRTTKTIMQAGMQQLVDFAWSIYSDADMYKKYHLGDNCDFFLQIVQRITPDMMVVQMVERYPTLVQMTHTLALVFRVPIEAGYMIAFRSIESPQLLNVIKAEGLSLSSSFFWETIQAANRNAQGECDSVDYVVTGSIGSDNPTYAKRARDEILIALVRSDVERTGVLDVPLESLTKQGGLSTSDNEATP